MSAPPAQPGSPYGPQMGAPYPPPPQTNGLAIASLIVGAFGFCTCGLGGVIGLILGVLALRQTAASTGRRGNGLAIAGVITSAAAVFLSGVFAAVIFPVFVQARTQAQIRICTQNQERIATAIGTYSDDYDQVLPPRAAWCDSISPYLLRGPRDLVCPAARAQRCGYAYNAFLDKLPRSKMLAPDQTVLTFDAVGSWNTSGDQGIVAPRHLDGAVLGFADGHSKRYTMTELSTQGQRFWSPNGLPATGELRLPASAARTAASGNALERHQSAP